MLSSAGLLSPDFVVSKSARPHLAQRPSTCGIVGLPAADLGGLVLGIGENLLGAYVTGNELKLTIALVLIFAILVMRPQGLLGEKTIQRV
jgi:hypothetical protein